VLVISSYLPELLGICDRIGVMCRGKLTAVKDAADWTEQEIMRHATGHREAV
jgi:ribose transport system ATP-binding protein